MKQADTNTLQMSCKTKHEKYFKRCNNFKEKMTRWKQWTKPLKKKNQTDRKTIKTSRVYWKKKADIMGWWQISYSGSNQELKQYWIIPSLMWYKNFLWPFKSSHENKLLKSAKQYGLVRYGYSFIWTGRYSTSLSSGHKTGYFCFWTCVMLNAPYRWNKFVLKRRKRELLQWKHTSAI